MYAVYFCEVFGGGAGDHFDGAEMIEERAFALAADAGDFVEGGACEGVLAFGAVAFDGEAMGFVA